MGAAPSLYEARSYRRRHTEAHHTRRVTDEMYSASGLNLDVCRRVASCCAAGRRPRSTGAGAGRGIRCGNQANRRRTAAIFVGGSHYRMWQNL
jgi:hypothetical protein